MENGDRIWWLKEEKSGWGGTRRIGGTFVERTAKRVTIEVLMKDGKLVRKSVSPERVIPREDAPASETVAESQSSLRSSVEALTALYHNHKPKMIEVPEGEYDALKAKLARAEAALVEIQQMTRPHDMRGGLAEKIHGIVMDALDTAEQGK